MKRVNAIVKKQGKLTELFTRKATRIVRAVESAIDYAKDQVDICKETAEDIMNSFGEVAENTDREELQNRLNAYAAKMDEAATWERYAKYFEDLRNKLNEEVEVEE